MRCTVASSSAVIRRDERRSHWSSVRRSGKSGRMDDIGWVGFVASACDCSATHRTTARSGGCRYSPKMSRTCGANNGSSHSWNVSSRCGWSPKSCQMRETVDGLRPHRAAIERVLKCLEPSRGASSVSRTTRSTTSSPTRRGAPGRGSSSKPSMPRARKRLRHLPTVARVEPSSSASDESLRPAALPSTIRARNAMTSLVVESRTQCSSPLRSSAVSFGIWRV